MTSITVNDTGEAWQDVSSSPLERLSYLLTSGFLSDVTIRIPSSQTTFKVHKLVLAMSSCVFEAMFFGLLSEGNDLSFPDDNPIAFKWILDHLYRGLTKLPDVQTALEILSLSHKYQIRSGVKICVNYLGANLSVVTFPAAFNAAILYEEQDLYKRCTQLLYENADDILSLPEFEILTVEAVDRLLSLESMSVSSEANIFNALVRWGEKRIRSRGNAVSPYSLRREIDFFLPKLRLLTLSKGEFEYYVSPMQLFTPEEERTILWKLQLTAGPNIPYPSEEHLVSATRSARASGQAGRGYFPRVVDTITRLTEIYADDDELRPRYVLSVQVSRVIYVLQIGLVMDQADSESRSIMAVRRNGKTIAIALSANMKVWKFPRPVRMEPELEYYIILTENSGSAHIESVDPEYYKLHGNQSVGQLTVVFGI